MPRGPSRTANRTDLTRPAPIQTAPGQEYGAAAAQQAAQQQIPTAGGQNITPGGGQPPAPAPGGGPDAMLQALQSHAAAHPVGAHGPLDRPTERPNEPVTHGLPVGPGAGPEALGGVGALVGNNTLEQGTLANLLGNMAAQPGATSAIQYLAGQAANGRL